MRRLLLVVFVGLIAWMVRSLARSGRVAPRPDRSTPAPDAGGRMVRDLVCNTYLPRERAMSLTRDGREHFFCSETCRTAFLDR